MVKEKEVWYVTRKTKYASEKVEKVEHVEKGLKTLNLKLKAIDTKIRSFDAKKKNHPRMKIKEFTKKLNVVHVTAQIYQRETIILQ